MARLTREGWARVGRKVRRWDANGTVVGPPEVMTERLSDMGKCR